MLTDDLLPAEGIDPQIWMKPALRRHLDVTEAASRFINLERYSPLPRFSFLRMIAPMAALVVGVLCSIQVVRMVAEVITRG